MQHWPCRCLDCFPDRAECEGENRPFVYQAVSGGYNLAMSSFDEANGLVNFNGFVIRTIIFAFLPEIIPTWSGTAC